MPKILILIFLLIFCLSSEVLADDSSPELEINSDKSVYSIGDPVNLRIRLKGKGFTLGDINKNELEPFEYAGREASFDEESQTTVLTVKGSVFEVGEFTLPSLEISDSEGKIYKTRPVTLIVKPLLTGDEQDIKPLKEQVEIMEGGPLWPWIVVALIVIAIIAAIFFLRRRRVEEAPEKIHVKTVPPHVEALKELERIEKLSLLREGRVKEYYTLVADALRIFEGKINDFDAMEMTTEELVSALEKGGYENPASIKNFLTHCDMVKFAKFTPPEMDIAALMDRAREIIKKDTPKMPVSDMSDEIEESREEEIALS